MEVPIPYKGMVPGTTPVGGGIGGTPQGGVPPIPPAYGGGTGGTPPRGGTPQKWANYRGFPMVFY